MAQDKTPKRGCRWPVVDNPHRSRLIMLSSPRLIVYSSGGSPGGVDPGGGEVLIPWKYVERVIVWSDPLKCHILSFRTCCITAFFTASRMNSLTLSLHWSCWWWRCHPYVWSAPGRQCPQISAFAVILGSKLSWPKTKRGCRWPTLNIPNRWCTNKKIHSACKSVDV